MRRTGADPQARTQRFVLGTAQLCEPYGVVRSRDESSLDQAAAILSAAAEIGVDALDTAPAYGDAEALIGAAGIDFAVHTKLSPGVPPADSLAASLQRLERGHVEVAYFHDPTVALRIDPVIDEAAALLDGPVGRLGVSVYEATEFAAALAIPVITVVQAPVSLLDRRIGADLLTAAAARGVLVLARSVFLQGVLLAPPERLPPRLDGLRSHVDSLRRLAADLERSPAELAMGWVRAQPGVDGIVVGAESAAQLRDLHRWWQRSALAADELAALATVPPAPAALIDPRRW